MHCQKDITNYLRKVCYQSHVLRFVLLLYYIIVANQKTYHQFLPNQALRDDLRLLVQDFGQWVLDVLTRLNLIIEIRRTCDSIEMSDPPTPWELIQRQYEHRNCVYKRSSNSYNFCYIIELVKLYFKLLLLWK